jgi:sensor histidine kinase regulating citrate/malate metabolism
VPPPARLARPGAWSIARQLLVLQVLLLAALVAAGTVAAVLEARGSTDSATRARVTDIARTLADSPYVRAAAVSEDPSSRLQPYAERVRRDTGTTFVVVMAPDRTRWSHPDPANIGKPFIGRIGPALRGKTFTETYTGTLGPSVRAVTPVFGADGTVVGLVSVGITTDRIGAELARRLPPLLAAGGLALLVALAGAFLVSRRLRRQTAGLAPDEVRRMYESYDALLHAVREGLVVVDHDGKVQVVNDEARRLLGLPEVAPGTPVGALDLPPVFARLLSSGRTADDEVHLTGDRTLLVNQGAATWHGSDVGTVTTLRDHTELRELSGELDTTRGLAEALRSQAHEAANRLHTVVSLVETGRAAEAVELATAELQLAQVLTDRLLSAVEEPVLAALLLGKAAQAAERGVDLRVDDETDVSSTPLDARDLVTLVGNLVDNAVDAAVAGPTPRWVEVSVQSSEGGDFRLRVADSGSGLPEADVEEAFTRGWSTKPAGPANGSVGRGIGLSLVGQVVRRHGGTVEVRQESGTVFQVVLPGREAVP